MLLELELPESTVRKIRALGALTEHKANVGKLIEQKIDSFLTEMIQVELGVYPATHGNWKPNGVTQDAEEYAEKDISSLYEEPDKEQINENQYKDDEGAELSDTTMEDLDYPLEEDEDHAELTEVPQSGYKDPFMAEMQKMVGKAPSKPHNANVQEVRFSDPGAWGDDTPRADGRESVGPDVLPVDFGIDSISGPRDTKNAMAFFNNSVEGRQGDKTKRTPKKMARRM